jgi:hypothetical protein
MDRIARAVKPGMLEEDTVAEGRKILKEMSKTRPPVRHPGQLAVAVMKGRREKDKC